MKKYNNNNLDKTQSLEKQKLDKKILFGTSWTAIEVFGNQIMRFVIKLVLAKVLAPEYFGLVGMTVIFTGFIQVISEFGMSSALVQYKKKIVPEIYYSTAFWINFFISIIGIFIIIFLITPFAVWFYKEPELKIFFPFLSLPIFFRALIETNKARLLRELDFRVITQIELFAMFVSGAVSIILAFLGFGIWALVVNNILGVFISVPLYFLSTSWKPKISFSKKAFSELFRFSNFVLVERIFIFLTDNIDYLIIGKILGSKVLGLYTLAFIITNGIRNALMGILNKVFFSVYSSMQDNIESIKKYYLKVVKYNTLCLFPIMTILIFLGDLIILFLLGEKWIGAVTPLQLLSIGVIIHASGGSSAVVIRSMGRPDLTMKANVIKTLFCTIPAILVGALIWGVTGACYGIILHKIVGRIIQYFYINKLTGLKIRSLFLQIYSQLIVCAIIGLGILGVKNLLGNYLILSFLVSVFSSAIIYFIYILFFQKDELELIRRVLKKK